MPSIFSQEWRDCLRAHYTYVVRMGDAGTEKTLRGVMYEAGFGEDEVKELYVLATAHVDDVGADFVPDMEVFEEAEPTPMMVAVVVPEEIIEAELIDEMNATEEIAVSETIVDLDEEADFEAEYDETELDEAEEDEPPKADPDVTQLSLF
jgi:hypothetical protein